MALPSRPGPFRPEMVKDGDRYEISRGHPIYVQPSGGRHGTEHLVGARPLATDPAVSEIGIDVGYALGEHTLRAPDIAVGNVPNEPGWAKGAPRLAVEYADRGTDEEDLRDKIGELLAAGTEAVWVVRLVGPRRVEVHVQGEPMRTLSDGDRLEAPGILARPVPVEAMFDAERANAAALGNLLAREGYESADALRAEGVRMAIETACELLDLRIDEPRRAQLGVADLPGLESILRHLRAHRAWP